MTGLYEIETERLVLRQWREGDWVGLHRTYGDPEVMSWIGAAPADLASTAAAVGRMSMHWLLLGYGNVRGRGKDERRDRRSGRADAASRLAARGTEDRGRLDTPTLRVGPRLHHRRGEGEPRVRLRCARSSSDLQHDSARQRSLPCGDGTMRLDATWRTGFPWLATGPLCDRSAELAAS